MGVLFRFHHSILAVGLTAVLLFSGIGAAADLSGADVMGIKLGMTPEQVTKLLEDSKKEFRIHPTKMVTYDHEFVAQVIAQEMSPSMKIKDLITVDFAPPPSDNIAVSIKRSRMYQEGERLSMENVEAALEKKYGKPINRTVNSINRILDWHKIPGNCMRLLGFTLYNRPYIVKDNDVFAVMSMGEKCPQILHVTLSGTGGGDAVRSISTLLMDYPTLYQAAVDNSNLGKQWKANKTKKRSQRGGPSDL